MKKRDVIKFTICLMILFMNSKINAKEIELILIAGQSNAQGWKGDGSQYPNNSIDKSIPLYYFSPKIGSSEGAWTTLGPQKGRFPKGHFGPEVTFARSLKKANREIAVFKYTLGSTSLVGRWKKPGEDGMYDEMMLEYSKALKLLMKKYSKVKFSTFIWIQGESDSKRGREDKYEEYLNALIKDLRIKTQTKDFSILLGLDEEHSACKKNPKVIQVQKDYAKKDKYAIFTSMKGLEKADSTHLTPAGLEEHGKRLYQAYLKLNTHRN